MASGVHDVGGADGFGAIDSTEPTAPFEHEWEARVFAINRALLRGGFYNLDQFRATVESLDPAVYRHASYYERWLLAIEKLMETR